MKHLLPLLLLAIATTGCASDAARFRHELLAADSATAVLQTHCPLAGEKIRAERDAETAAPAPPAILRALAVHPSETIRHRRVRLMCGPHLYSAADNWYVPERLTAAMNAALDGSDTPFGRVVAPLKPGRTTLTAKRHSGPAFLSVSAVLIAANGQPISGVIENYQRAVLRPAPHLPRPLN